MSNGSKALILRTAAQTLACELFAAAGYGRTHARINVEKFDRELRTAVRQWSAIQANLKTKKGTTP